MARYLNETEAAADGFRLVHEPEQSRFALYGPGAEATTSAPGAGAPAPEVTGAPAPEEAATTAPTERLVGEAHYTLRGEAAAGAGAGATGAGAAAATDTAAGTIDFDHTVVHPDFRGTGLSGLLAHRAVTDPVVHGRRVLASCWFIEGYLARHPELLHPST